jgi:hypothetical protein
MLGLLVLSLALSATAVAVGTDSSSAQPAPPGQADSFIVVDDAPARSFDKMELHPASGICYKIRAYVFSQDATPKFLRETTCGPNVSQTRKTNGYKPTVVIPEKTSDSASDKK